MDEYDDDCYYDDGVMITSGVVDAVPSPPPAPSNFFISFIRSFGC